MVGRGRLTKQSNRVEEEEEEGEEEEEEEETKHGTQSLEDSEASSKTLDFGGGVLISTLSTTQSDSQPIDC